MAVTRRSEELVVLDHHLAPQDGGHGPAVYLPAVPYAVVAQVQVGELQVLVDRRVDEDDVETVVSKVLEARNKVT